MTPAALDTRRRLLGLSIDELADVADVLPRQINRYFKGVAPIRSNLEARLDALERRMHLLVDEALHLAARSDPNGDGVVVTLYRYRTADHFAKTPHGDAMPLGAHAIAIGWAAQAMEEDNFEPRIAWADD